MKKNIGYVQKKITFHVALILICFLCTSIKSPNIDRTYEPLTLLNFLLVTRNFEESEDELRAAVLDSMKNLLVLEAGAGADCQQILLEVLHDTPPEASAWGSVFR